MASAMYLEHYLDSLESLPADLERNFNLIRDLDQKVQTMLGDAEEATTRYLAAARSQGKQERAANCREISGLFARGRVLADEKVQLAMQTYEMVDRHIRRLDTDLARFESELKERANRAAKGPGGAGAATAASGAGAGGAIDAVDGKDSGAESGRRGRKRKQRGGDADADTDGVGNRKLTKLEDEHHAAASGHGGGGAGGIDSSMLLAPSGMPITAALTLTLTNNPAEVLDMPVDPNEPTYCICHQVSYGDMVGCDNTDCPIEWFHFNCVGLSDKPKGKWFCPRCQDARKNKKA